MAQLGWWVLVALGGMTVMTGCGGGRHLGPAPTPRSVPTTTSRVLPPSSPSTTVSAPPASVPGAAPTTRPAPGGGARPTVTTVPDPPGVQAALQQLEAGLPSGGYAVSPVQQINGRPFVVVSRDGPAGQAAIDVDVYTAGRFRPSVAGIGAGQDLDPVVAGTIPVGRVTTSPVADFLVLLQGHQSRTGVLVSDAGGTWHIVGLEGRSGTAASDELVRPRLAGNHVIQAIDECSSSCGQGPYAITTYGYDPAAGELAQVGPPTQSPTP